MESQLHADTEMNSLIPLVSVIVPSFNHEKYISSCIRSVLAQTYPNFELIVIDDGSTDGSNALIQGLQKSHGFQYLKQKNAGLPVTINKALMMAKGKYISLLASDDEFLSIKLETLVRLMEQRDDTYAVAFGDAEFIDGDGLALSRVKNKCSYVTFIDYYLDWWRDGDKDRRLGTYESLISGNYIPAMSAIIRRDALFDVGLFDEDIAVEDWSIWLKLAKKYRFILYEGVVARYRIHGLNSVSTMTGRLASQTLRILQRERDYCRQNGHMARWKHSYNRALHSYCRSYGFKACTKKMTFTEFSGFIWFNIVRIYKLNIARFYFHAP